VIPYTERELKILNEIREASDILAEALGYHHDPEYGWATGDHTIVSLAMEVRSRGVYSPVTAPPIAPETYARSARRCNNPDCIACDP